jgi:T4 RnlA family RNA ligase
MNLNLLHQMLNEGYVNQQKHPEHNLYIYNYAAKVQYDGLWNEITLQCRGLIMNEQHAIIARPFPKFFNLEEMETLPALNFDVYEKMDGSLGILYWANNKPHIATRGSFVSEQAIKASELLHTKYKGTLHLLKKELTYLFEIIYPANRIVVNYGNQEELVLLAIIETATGKELPIVDIGFPIVKKYPSHTDIRLLKKLEQDNQEGFVIRFENGQRVKVKFEEYVRLHRIVTQVSSRTIWEFLKDKKPMTELLDKVPDEFYDWLKKTIHKMESQFGEIESICKHEFKTLSTRKETAAYFLQCRYPKILFLMLDNRNYDEVIWKMIRPEFSKPFKNNQHIE